MGAVVALLVLVLAVLAWVLVIVRRIDATAKESVRLSRRLIEERPTIYIKGSNAPDLAPRAPTR